MFFKFSVLKLLILKFVLIRKLDFMLSFLKNGAKVMLFSEWQAFGGKKFFRIQ